MGAQNESLSTLQSNLIFFNREDAYRIIVELFTEWNHGENYVSKSKLANCEIFCLVGFIHEERTRTQIHGAFLHDIREYIECAITCWLQGATPT